MHQDPFPISLVYGVYTVDLLATIVVLNCMVRLARTYPPLRGRNPGMLLAMTIAAFVWRLAALVVYGAIPPPIEGTGCVTWLFLGMHTLGAATWVALFAWRLQIFVDIFIRRAQSRIRQLCITAGILAPSILLWIIATAINGSACPVDKGSRVTGAVLLALYALLLGWYAFRLRSIRASYNESTELTISLLISGALFVFVLVIHGSEVAEGNWGIALILLAIAAAPSSAFYLLALPPLIHALRQDLEYLQEWHNTSEVLVGPVGTLLETLADPVARSKFREWMHDHAGENEPMASHLMALLDDIDRFRAMERAYDRKAAYGAICQTYLYSKGTSSVLIPQDIVAGVDHATRTVGLGCNRLDPVREWCIATIDRHFYKAYCQAMSPAELAAQQSTQLDENMMLHGEGLL